MREFSFFLYFICMWIFIHFCVSTVLWYFLQVVKYVGCSFLPCFPFRFFSVSASQALRCIMYNIHRDRLHFAPTPSYIFFFLFAHSNAVVRNLYKNKYEFFLCLLTWKTLDIIVIYLWIQTFMVKLLEHEMSKVIVVR